MDVYWSVDFWINELDPAAKYNVVPFVEYEDPENVYLKQQRTKLIKSGNPNVDYKFCPAFQNQTKNLYSLKFPFSYDLIYDGLDLRSNTYDQNFFNNMITVRSLEDRMVSFNIYYIFISEEPLEVEVTGAYMADNDFVNKTIMIPGRFDIGKWPRNLDCAFMFKKDTKFVSFKKGDDFNYLNFLTNEKINLKKFHISNPLREILESTQRAKKFHKKYQPLTYWYDVYQKAKYKKIVMREIKNNLME